MLKPSIHTKRVAFLLNMKPEDIDQKHLKAAVRTVQYQRRSYFDALAENQQAHGNVPKSMCIALVYNFGL